MPAVTQRQLQSHVLQIAHGADIGGERTFPKVLPLQRLYMSEELRRGLQRQGGDRDRKQVYLGHYAILRSEETFLIVRHSEVQQQDTCGTNADSERSEQ